MIPHAGLAPCTGLIGWREIDLRVYGAGDSAEGHFCHPDDDELRPLLLERGGDGFALRDDPIGRVNWRIQAAT